MRVVIGIAVIAASFAAVPARAEAPRERAAKLMKKLATDRKAAERADAARQLGDMRAWDAVDALAGALKDPSPDVRAAASGALVDLKDKARDAAPALKQALGDDDRVVRYNAIAALHNMDAAAPAELAGPIASLLDAAEEDERKALVSMFVHLDFDDAVARKVLLDQIDRGTPTLRLAVLDEMWSQHTMETRAPWKAEVAGRLAALVGGDRNAKVRRQAIVLLWQGKAVAGPVGDALMKALDDDDPEVAHQAASTLNGLEKNPLPANAVAHLVQRLKSPDPRARAGAARALGGLIGRRDTFRAQLIAALADKEPEVRVAAVDGLDDIDDDQAIPALLKALKTDPDPDVRVAVCKAWSATMSWMRFERTHTLDDVRTALTEARNDPRVKKAADAALAATTK